MRSNFPLRNSHFETDSGFSVIEVMVAAGLLSVVVLSMMVLSKHMTDNGMRSSADQVADNVAQQIQGILDQPSTCDNALRAGGSPVVWDYKNGGCLVPNVPAGVTHCAQVDQIKTTYCQNAGDTVGPTGACIPSDSPPQPRIAYTVGALTPTISIASMYLRLPMSIAGPPAVYEGAPNAVDMGLHSATPTSAALNYHSVSAVLVIHFQLTGNMANSGSIRDRTIPITLAIEDTGHTVDFCANNRMMQTIYDCSSAGYANFSPCGAAPAGRCVPTYMVSGFDAAGLPTCDCKWTCPPTATFWQAVPGCPAVGGQGGLAAALQKCPVDLLAKPNYMCFNAGQQCKIVTATGPCLIYNKFGLWTGLYAPEIFTCM